MIEVHVCVAMALMPAIVFGLIFLVGWSLTVLGAVMDYIYKKGIVNGWWKDNYPE